MAEVRQHLALGHPVCCRVAVVSVIEMQPFCSPGRAGYVENRECAYMFCLSSRFELRIVITAFS